MERYRLMKLKQKIGIIGKGFVGSAVQFGFSPNVGIDAEVRVYDKDPNKSTHSLIEVVTESDIIFLSVPTPSNIDGSMNIDIVESALADIDQFSDDYNFEIGIILLRSTVVPGTTRKLQ
jgi:UDPglucose 6-dehydrogenase